MPHADDGRFDIIVIGDVMLDQNVDGYVARISPEAPVPVLLEEQTTFKLGGAANVAAGLSILGSNVQLFSDFAIDEGDNKLVELLDQFRIRKRKIQSKERTTIKRRYFSGNNQVFRSDHEKNSPVPASLILENIDEVSQGFYTDYAILSDYAKGVVAESSELIRGLQKRGVKTIIDPKSTNLSDYYGAWLLKPNWKEFSAFWNTEISYDKIKQFAIRTCNEYNIKNLVITLGEKGIVLCSQDDEFVHFQSNASEVFDVTGAGDTVISTMSHFISQGKSLAKAVELANYAASKTVRVKGTYTVNMSELTKEIKRDPKCKYISQFDENELIKTIFRTGKIVFTNGCFDLLHEGHLDILNFCAEIGDYVIVGLNTDLSVKKNKGEMRPIIPYETRKSLLENLSCVDLVIGFDEKTPLALIQKVRPDVLVKGGDYTHDNVIGADYVKGYGGEVKIFEFRTMISTSKVIEKIKSKKED